MLTPLCPRSCSHPLPGPLGRWGALCSCSRPQCPLRSLPLPQPRVAAGESPEAQILGRAVETSSPTQGLRSEVSREISRKPLLGASAGAAARACGLLAVVGRRTAARLPLWAPAGRACGRVGSGAAPPPTVRSALLLMCAHPGGRRLPSPGTLSWGQNEGLDLRSKCLRVLGCRRPWRRKGERGERGRAERCSPPFTRALTPSWAPGLHPVTPSNPTLPKPPLSVPSYRGSALQRDSGGGTQASGREHQPAPGPSLVPCASRTPEPALPSP